jgi:copper resistance protein B
VSAAAWLLIAPMALGLTLPALAQEASMPMTQSEREHVPPDPPSQEVPAMPYRAMAEMMAMDDQAPIGKVMLDRLDWRDTQGGSSLEWDGAAWYGSDYNKLWFKAEGERRGGTIEDARNELLWDHIFSRWWSVQSGLRQDLGEGPSRTWAAVGVQGLAPYFFETEATVYVGEGGRTAARLASEYDLLLTQRLILQPEAELNLYGKDDPQRRIGSGLSDVQIGLRLRYEFRREFAPYVGLVWSRRFGKSADLAREAGGDPNDLQLLAGLRIWF